MTRVAIIGGGIGGLTAANALLRAGAEVYVYEAAGELKEIGAGVALHANAMRVLRFIGVEDGRAEGRGRDRVRGHQGRDHRAGHLQDEPGAAGGAAGHRAGDRAPGRPARRARRGAARGHRVARQAVRRPSDVRGVVGDRAVRGRHNRRGGRDHRRGRDPLRRADGAVRAGRAAVHREDLLPVGHPGGGRARRRAVGRGGGQRAVARAARHDRALPAARRGADQRRLPLRRRHLPARVVGDASASAPRSSSGTRGGTSRCCGCSRPGTPGTSGRCTTGTRSPPGRRGG